MTTTVCVISYWVMVLATFIAATDTKRNGLKLPLSQCLAAGVLWPVLAVSQLFTVWRERTK